MRWRCSFGSLGSKVFERELLLHFFTESIVHYLLAIFRVTDNLDESCLTKGGVAQFLSFTEPCRFSSYLSPELVRIIENNKKICSALLFFCSISINKWLEAESRSTLNWIMMNSISKVTERRVSVTTENQRQASILLPPLVLFASEHRALCPSSLQMQLRVTFFFPYIFPAISISFLSLSFSTAFLAAGRLTSTVYQ
jgi:hypothetical protein